MSKCEHCGGEHLARCPDVKAVEYHTSGRIKRVEYFSNAEKFATYPPYPYQVYPVYPTSPSVISTTSPPYPFATCGA
jgi:hypothetical protein